MSIEGGADSYSQVVLAKGPVGYWRLGEASGPAAFDSSGNGNGGTYFGNPSFGQPGAINDDPGTAVGFNGPSSGDYVEVPDPDARPFSQPTSGAGLTVEAWMRPDALVFSGQTDDPYVHWFGKGMPDIEEWGMHVVAVCDPGNMDTPLAGVSLYKNGVLRKSPPDPGTLYANYDIVPADGGAPVRFATRDRNSFFAGGLAEVAIYPRVLTGAAIMENYSAGIS